MEQIAIIKPDASIVKLGGTSPYRIITRAEQNMALMGEDIVELEVISEGTINVGIGDTILVFGRKYTLLELPSIERITDERLKYNLYFKGAIHVMQLAVFKLAGSLGTNATGDFTLMADLSKFIDLLIENMNSYSGVWVKGSIPETVTKNLTFENENCQNVLSKLSDEFALEFKINYVDSEWVIDFAEKVGRDLPDILSYAKGIRSLKRKFVSEESFTTKLYAFGSKNNLPSNYRNYSPRLKMPVNLAGDYEPPTAPQNLTAIAVNVEGSMLDTAHLEWSASTDNIGVVYYIIYVSYDGGAFIWVDDTVNLSFDVPNMPINTEISFKVKAVDAAGNKSRSSNSAPLFIPANLVPPVLVDVSQSDEGILVLWNQPTTDYESVEIWRKENNASYILRATKDHPATSYEDPVIKIPGRRYSYKLRSEKSGFYSIFGTPLTYEF